MGDETYTVQLLGVNIKSHGEGVVTFGCSLDILSEIQKFIEDAVIKFWISGAEDDFITGFVSSSSVNNSSSDSKCKFKIKTSESELMKVAQLSALCGKELEVGIEVNG